MVMQTKTITNTGTAEFENLERYEHHKIDLIVTDFSSQVSFKIEDLSNITSTAINLDSMDRTFYINNNDAEGFIIENMRLRKIRVNVLTGTATIQINYTGW